MTARVRLATRDIDVGDEFCLLSDFSSGDVLFENGIVSWNAFTSSDEFKKGRSSNNSIYQDLSGFCGNTVGTVVSSIFTYFVARDKGCFVFLSRGISRPT